MAMGSSETAHLRTDPQTFVQLLATPQLVACRLGAVGPGRLITAFFVANQRPKLWPKVYPQPDFARS